MLGCNNQDGFISKKFKVLVCILWEMTQRIYCLEILSEAPRTWPHRWRGWRILIQDLLNKQSKLFQNLIANFLIDELNDASEKDDANEALFDQNLFKIYISVSHFLELSINHSFPASLDQWCVFSFLGYHVCLFSFFVREWVYVKLCAWPDRFFTRFFLSFFLWYIRVLLIL